MRSIKLTRELVNSYCELIGDDNPIHKEPHNIVPGMLISSLFTQKPKENVIIRSIEIKFSKPIFINETIDIKESCTNSKKSSRFIIHEMQYDICVDGDIRQTMKAIVCEIC